MKRWIYVVLKYATFALEMDEDEIITVAPPIAKWAQGKRAGELKSYFEKRGVLLHWEERR